MWKTSTLLRCIQEAKTSMEQENKATLVDNNLVSSIYDINQLIAKRYPNEPDLLIITDRICLFEIDVGNSIVSYKKESDGEGLREVNGQKVSKFLSQNSKLKPEQIATIASDIKNRAYYLIFASSNYRIWYVAGGERSNIGSCMAYPASHFGRENPDYDEATSPPYEKYLHPVTAYEGCDDVRLALLFNENPFEWDGETDFPLVARAIIGKHKCFNRIYSKNSSIAVAMHRLLEMNEYDTEDDLLDGVTLNVQKDVCDTYVVPYFDPENRRFFVCDATDTITINNDDGDYQTLHSNGSIEKVDKPTQYCSHCNEYHDEDESFVNLYDSYGDTNGIVVGCCRNSDTLVSLDYGSIEGVTDCENVTWSEYEDGYIHDSHVIRVWADNEELIITYMGSREHDESVTLNDSLDGVEDANEDACIRTEDGCFFLRDKQADLYFQCAIDGEYYSHEDTITDELKHSGLIINTANLELTE